MDAERELVVVPGELIELMVEVIVELIVEPIVVMIVQTILETIVEPIELVAFIAGAAQTRRIHISNKI